MSKPSGLELLQSMIAGRIQPAPTCGFVGHPHESQENPMGTIHGGWYATLLDSAMGSAVLTTLDATLAYTTAQLARVATAEGRLVDEAGKLYAHATTTCLVFPRS